MSSTSQKARLFLGILQRLCGRHIHRGRKGEGAHASVVIEKVFGAAVNMWAGPVGCVLRWILTRAMIQCGPSCEVTQMPLSTHWFQFHTATTLPPSLNSIPPPWPKSQLFQGRFLIV